MSQSLVSRFVLSFAWGAIVTTFAQPVDAQDFRVYTTVRNIAEDSTNPPVVARSLTLFHTGKVYDYMDEPGELVIFEPIHDRFVIIRGYVGTIVPTDELRQLLDVAHHEGERLADELAASNEPRSRGARANLLFQLNPTFRTAWADSSGELTLQGSELSYMARLIEIESPSVVPRYLAYTDAAAKMNSVLHPHGLLPSSRLKLNEAMREQDRLPQSVTLKGITGTNLHMRADHEYGWQLQAIDKDLIHQWEQLRQSDRMQWVSFREYQQRLVSRSAEK